ncbi:hypothetical protein ABIB06_006567 [Bradyrhizobium sp. LB8.2]
MRKFNALSEGRERKFRPLSFLAGTLTFGWYIAGGGEFSG